MPHRFSFDPRDLSRESPLTLPGPAGTLEGLWRPPMAGRPVRGVVVVAHPHPAHRGTMMNKVVFHTARVLNHDLDLATLRFNFRGVGESQGAYDEGRGEVDDVAAAWTEARRRVPEGPLVGAGFSFGSAMTLLAATGPGALRPDAFALLGVPMRLFPFPVPYPVAIPAAVVHGARDQYTAPEAVGAYLESWPAPHRFRVEPETDHFFEGRLVEATRFLSQSLKEWL